MRVLQIVADGNPGGGTTHVLHLLRSLGGTYTFGLVTQANPYWELSTPWSHLGERAAICQTCAC